jgi:hypothetical protein
MEKLWIDTNQARSVTDLRKLCSLARSKDVQIVIHAQVYLERRRQMRVECAANGRPFVEAIFDGFLAQEGIKVPAFLFDQKTVSEWADVLYRRYPEKGAWEAAKKQALGGELRAGFQVLPGDMPMTTDWLISLVVEGDTSSRIISRDDGEEWRALREMAPKRVFTFKEALDWLYGLPDPPAPE